MKPALCGMSFDACQFGKFWDILLLLDVWRIWFVICFSGFEECRRQGETLNCPLCRAEWKSNSNDNNNV